MLGFIIVILYQLSNEFIVPLGFYQSVLEVQDEIESKRIGSLILLDCQVLALFLCSAL